MYKKFLYLSVIAAVACFAGVARAQNYFLNGSAVNTGQDCYNVTPNIGTQNGSIWYADQIDLNESFELEFLMSYGNEDINGADGMVFVLQTVGTFAMGGAGGGMGFEGFSPSFGVEFDTYQNSFDNGDPTYDHLAFLKNGVVNHNGVNNLAGPIQANALNGNIEDGLDHIIRISWNAETFLIECYFDCVLRLSATVDMISSIFGGQGLVYWGFTGSTGGLFNEQSVCLSQNILGSPDDVSVCENGSVQLWAPGPPDGIYEWSPTDGLDNPLIQNPIASPTVSTEYTVTYTDFCGNNQTENVFVTVQALPEITVPDDLIICENDNGLIDISVSPGLMLYTWTTEDGEIIGSASIEDVNVASAGTYVIDISSEFGCSSTSSVSVFEQMIPNWWIPEEIYSLCPEEITQLGSTGNWTSTWDPEAVVADFYELEEPGSYSVTHVLDACTETYTFEAIESVLPTLDLGIDQTICSDETVVLNAGANAQWSNGIFDSSIIVNETGTYSYLYIDGLCQSADTVFVEVFELPVLELGDDAELCSNDTLYLEAPMIGLWSTGAIDDILEVTDEGIYSVQVSNGPCTVFDEILVSAINLPEFDLGPDVVICDDVDFVLSVPELDMNEYLWNTGDNSPEIGVFTSGTYKVEVSNLCGVVADSVFVTIEECSSSIFVPNSFTPNDDGINDVWQPSIYNTLSYEVFIFDRWGKEVFYSNDPQAAWIGNVGQGRHYVQNESYTWMIIYETPRKVIERIQGVVTIIR
jgi:gliding motility-associated-like protein